MKRNELPPSKKAKQEKRGVIEPKPKSSGRRFGLVAVLAAGVMVGLDRLPKPKPDLQPKGTDHLLKDSLKKERMR